MDADERLTALKKAYADIILNTAKEAAARIMVSERKALRFEHELKNAKEDAIQMLLKLKQMMDFKINEAAVATSCQQKKIEELEAQLQEAEDIVKDLREELRAVEAELERLSPNKQVKQTGQVDNASALEPITCPPSVLQPSSNIDQTNKSQICYNSLFPFKKSLISNTDLPSIILRSKETEQYRNGCTQRIRACELTPPNKQLSCSVETNDINVNPDVILTKDEEQALEKEIYLKLVTEMELRADSSCLTSPSSVKHINDTTTEENPSESRTIVKDLVGTCNSQSTSGEELMPKQQEKDEVDPPLTSTESKVSKINEVPSQPLTDRVIKYTFQRKRKRGALIDGSGSSERSQENQTVHVGPGKVNLTGESTPEKIRLEQVARQLISLSDKKWW